MCFIGMVVGEMYERSSWWLTLGGGNSTNFGLEVDRTYDMYKGILGNIT